MKRITAFCVAVVLLLSCSACKSEEEDGIKKPSFDAKTYTTEESKERFDLYFQEIYKILGNYGIEASDLTYSDYNYGCLQEYEYQFEDGTNLFIQLKNESDLKPSYETFDIGLISTRKDECKDVILDYTAYDCYFALAQYLSGKDDTLSRAKELCSDASKEMERKDYKFNDDFWSKKSAYNDAEDWYMVYKVTKSYDHTQYYSGLGFTGFLNID